MSGRARCVFHVLTAALMLVGTTSGGSDCLAQEVSTARQTLQAELANVRRELATLRAHPAPAVLANPGFEASELNAPNGWQVQPGSGGVVEFDVQNKFEGQQSVHLAVRESAEQTSSIVALRSAAFQLPASRRVAVTAWMRVDPAAAAPPVWLVLEGKYKGQPFSHHVEVSGAAHAGGLAPLSGEWSPVTLQLDELPTDGGITDLVVGVELRGKGELWIDSVQLTDMWLNDQEQRALMAQVETADGHLLAGRFEQMQLVLKETLPQMLSQYASVEYLVPSLSQAVPALVAVAQEANSAPITVGRAVSPSPVGRAPIAQSSASGQSGAANEQPITPIGAEEQPVRQTAEAPTSTPGAAIAAAKPTVLAPSANTTSPLATAPGGASAKPLAANPAVATAPIRTVSPITNRALAGGTVTVTTPETEQQPWWKFWNRDDQSTARQAPRTMPGTYNPQRRSAQNVAVAGGAPADEATATASTSTFQRWRQRFQPEEQEAAGALATAQPAESNQPGFLRRMRLPFTGEESAQTAGTQPVSENSRRFALFSGSDASEASANQVAASTGTTATRDPFALPADAAPVQPASAQQEEPKESRFAALRRLFRSDDESATLTK